MSLLLPVLWLAVHLLCLDLNKLPAVDCLVVILSNQYGCQKVDNCCNCGIYAVSQVLKKYNTVLHACVILVRLFLVSPIKRDLVGYIVSLE